MGRRGEVMLGCWDCSFPRHQERCGAQERGNDHIDESGAGLDLIGVCELPIGIQTFENLIREDFVYVNKTPFISKLGNEGKYL